jgi:diacylglycerol O-acyltransferase / wax synthase
MERLSPVDAAWYRMDSARSPADIVGLLVLDGEVDEARLRERIETRLRLHPRFHQRVLEPPLKLAAPRWLNEREATLDHHFSKRRLPAPGGQPELIALVTELMNEPLDFQHSPWRVCLIEGCAEGSAVFARLHHCMGDGFALVQILLSFADETPSARTPAVVHPRLPQRLRAHAAELRQLTRRAPRTLRDLARLLLLSFDPPTRFRGRLSGERRIAWSGPIPLARVRALAHAQRCTINDLLLATLTGALRTYLDESGERPQTFRAIVPVNLRAGGDTAIDRRGNWFGLVFLALPIAEPERHGRLSALKHASDALKHSEQPLASIVVLSVLGRAPAVIERFAKRLFARKGTLVASNVAGPREALAILGRRVRELYFFVPHPSELACGVSILSYAGVIRVGVRSDLAVIADPERIVDRFERELAAWEEQ